MTQGNPHDPTTPWVTGVEPGKDQARENDRGSENAPAHGARGEQEYISAHGGPVRPFDPWGIPQVVVGEDAGITTVADPAKAFFSAAQTGEDELVEALLGEGLSVNLRDPETGATALHYAAENAARRVLRVLLKTGQCDFLAKDKEGRRPSELADIYGNDPAMARLLLRKEIEQARRQGVAPQNR